MSLTSCVVCGGANVRYAPLTTGREYRCDDCGVNHPYPEELLPPRLKLLREGRTTELREALRRELPDGAGADLSAIKTFYDWLQRDEVIE